MRCPEKNQRVVINCFSPYSYELYGIHISGAYQVAAVVNSLNEEVVSSHRVKGQPYKTKAPGP